MDRSKELSILVLNKKILQIVFVSKKLIKLLLVFIGIYFFKFILNVEFAWTKSHRLNIFLQLIPLKWFGAELIKAHNINHI